jgi:hypothetical protein
MQPFNTTLVGQKRNSNMQLMGETREPMAEDCWTDAQNLAHKFAKVWKCDFWILFAAKPHVSLDNTIIAGWHVIEQRPAQGMVGVLVFKWDNNERRLEVDAALSLPYDVPISEAEMSKQEQDYTPSIAEAGKMSGSILLA